MTHEFESLISNSDTAQNTELRVCNLYVVDSPAEHWPPSRLSVVHLVTKDAQESLVCIDREDNRGLSGTNCLSRLKAELLANQQISLAANWYDVPSSRTVPTHRQRVAYPVKFEGTQVSWGVALPLAKLAATLGISEAVLSSSPEPLAA